MVTVFTLCSSNYLAHAKVLGDSVMEHNPGYHFVIGLVDPVPKELEPSYWQPYELILVEEIKIPEFGEMVRDYNVVELNTAVKPFLYFKCYARSINWFRNLRRRTARNEMWALREVHCK